MTAPSFTVPWQIAPRAPAVETIVETEPRRRTFVALAAMLAVLSFGVHAILMHAFDARALFYLNDTLFNADTQSMWNEVSHGARSISQLTPGLRNSVHPYLWIYFGVPIRLLAKATTVAFPGHIDDVALRAHLGLFVLPFVSALYSAALAILLRALGCSMRQILLISLLAIAAFSNLMFGAIPEHFAVSNLAIALLTLRAVRAAEHRGLDRAVGWIPLGLFATGITLTNVIVLGVAHWFAGLARGKAFAPRLVKSAALSLAIGLFVLASAHAMGIVMDGPATAETVRGDFVQRFTRSEANVETALRRALAALGHSVAPAWDDVDTARPTAVPEPYDPALTPPFGTASPYPAYTFETATDGPPGWSPRGLAVLALILIGAGLLIARGGAPRLAAVLALALIAFNLSFHSVWGDEFFVYSQHWMTPLIVLAAGLVLGPRRTHPVGEIAIAGLIVAIAWNDFHFFRHLLAVLDAAAAHGTALAGAPF